MKFYDLLEIMLITYNRANLLERTLWALNKSPFSKCKITVLDNCSVDSTASVCNMFRRLFERYDVVRHKVNIGGDANFLRAVELSRSVYTWVLCDDDTYDFSDCKDVIAQIESHSVELIHMGAHDDGLWKRYGGLTATARDLRDKGYPYYKYSSFIPCNLFKTECFHEYMILGYKNILNMYPHMPYLLSFMDEARKIYIAQKQIVFAGLGMQAYGFREWFSGWYHTALLLARKKDAVACMRDQYDRSTFGKRLRSDYSIMHGCRMNGLSYARYFSVSSVVMFFLYIPIRFVVTVRSMYRNTPPHPCFL